MADDLGELVYNEERINDAQVLLEEIKNDLYDTDCLLYDAVMKISYAPGIEHVEGDDAAIDMRMPEKLMIQCREETKSISDTLNNQVSLIQSYSSQSAGTAKGSSEKTGVLKRKPSQSPSGEEELYQEAKTDNNTLEKLEVNKSLSDKQLSGTTSIGDAAKAIIKKEMNSPTGTAQLYQQAQKSSNGLEKLVKKVSDSPSGTVQLSKEAKVGTAAAVAIVKKSAETNSALEKLTNNTKATIRSQLVEDYTTEIEPVQDLYGPPTGNYSTEIEPVQDLYGPPTGNYSTDVEPELEPPITDTGEGPILDDDLDTLFPITDGGNTQLLYGPPVPITEPETEIQVIKVNMPTYNNLPPTNQIEVPQTIPVADPQTVPVTVPNNEFSVPQTEPVPVTIPSNDVEVVQNVEPVTTTPPVKTEVTHPIYETTSTVYSVIVPETSTATTTSYTPAPAPVVAPSVNASPASEPVTVPSTSVPTTIGVGQHDPFSNISSGVGNIPDATSSINSSSSTSKSTGHTIYITPTTLGAAAGVGAVAGLAGYAVTHKNKKKKDEDE